MVSGTHESVQKKSKLSPYHVQVLDRAVALIETLACESQDLTLGELYERLGIHKSTVYRLLMVLERHGFVEKSPQNGRYRLGLKFFELANSVTARLDFRERARPHLERLVAETNETVHLCILNQGEVVYLEKVEASRTFRIPSIVGGRYPAHCGAAGKALLAFLSETELEELIRKRGLRRFTSQTITSPRALKAELRRIAERGYSIDNEEFEEGLKCLGAPVRDYSGRVIAAISLAGPAFRLTKDRLPVVARGVVKAANELSAELGYGVGAASERMTTAAQGSR